MEKYRIAVTDKPDVVFRGEMLAQAGHSPVGEAITITLYQTEKGKYVVVREAIDTLLTDNPTLTTCATSKTLPPFRKFLGQDECAKRFYKKAGIYNAVRIP